MLVALLFTACGKADKDMLISDGTVFVPKDHYPAFSWESTPMYYMFGDGSRLLEPGEVEFVAARTDFVCIEKSHGWQVTGAAELGAKHEAEAFKKVRPDIKVLYYFNSAWAWPFTSYNQYFTPEQIGDHPELKRYLLTDPETGELYYRGSYIRHTYGFDVLKPEMREWWVNTVVRGVEESGCDGVFIDQMHGFFFVREDRKEEVLRAQGALMDSLRSRLPADKILLGNNTNDEIARFAYPSVDATMFEHYNSKLLSKENLLEEWDLMLKNAREGKMTIFRIGVEHEEEARVDGNRVSEEQMAEVSRDKLEYYLACFLIGAQPYSFFQYGWGWNLHDGSLYDYPELQRPLGAPNGAYQRSDPYGWEFTREFEHASVWVDTDKKEARISWH